LYQEGDDSYIQEGEPPGYIFVDPLPQPALFLPGEITKARPIKVALQPSIPKKDQKKKWKMADPRLEKRAKRLVEKYASSCPPRAGPPVSAQDGLMEVWEWAEKKDRTDILSSLSQVAGVLFRATGQESLFRSKLSNLIERAKVEQRLDEYDDLLLGLANVEKKVEVRLAAYEEALRVYSLLGDTGGEAVSAALVAEIYQQQNKIQEALCLYLHSFSLWSKLEHKMGIGISLMHLSRILELEGRFVDASQMMYVARKTIPASLWKISARDSLNRIVFEYELASEQCETKMTPEELVRTIFSSV
jgi:tetratricopeptide (TPR) repeat protein